MSVSEDITAGNSCRMCHMFLIAENDKVCGCGYPVLCEDCWRELPKKERRGVAYFREKTGEVVSN